MTDRVRTSVGVPAFRAWSTLPAVLDALASQVHDGCEVLVFESGTRDDAPFARWPWVRAVTVPERVLPGEARNRAAAAARGDVLVFLDADAVPDPGWLAALESALRPGVDAVAGAVGNGTPASAVGTAGWALEFADWHTDRRTPLRHAASCNLLVRRAALRDGFATDLWPGEDTLLSAPLAAAGRLAFAPDARVRHLNRTGLVDFLRHQVRLGRVFPAVTARALGRPLLGRRLLVPLTFPLRLAAVAVRLRRIGDDVQSRRRVAPLVVLGAAAWAVGVASAPRQR
jgi:GT2 family glycosyltransferase